MVTLTTGDTSFKQRRDFDRHISLLSKYHDKQNVWSCNEGQRR